MNFYFFILLNIKKMMGKYTGSINMTNVPQFNYSGNVTNIITAPQRTVESILQGIEYPSGESSRKFTSGEINKMLDLKWEDRSGVLSLENPELIFEITYIFIQSMNLDQVFN